MLGLHDMDASHAQNHVTVCAEARRLENTQYKTNNTIFLIICNLASI